LTSSGGGARPKRAGKTQWADRRRPATRRAGFSVHPEVTGGELQISGVGGWRIHEQGAICVRFAFPASEPGTLLGWGLWYFAPPEARALLEGFPHRVTLKPPAAPNWSKAGSVWFSDGEPLQFSFCVEANTACDIAFYDVQAGALEHEYYDITKTAVEPKRHAKLMSNMWDFAPEANFVSPRLHVVVSDPEAGGDAAPIDEVAEIYLKSCNRCGRFLPINVDNERFQLSFSNHCVARRPCRHSTFGRLRNVLDDEVLQLEYGFQLECRFCKKFEVNAPHNPQRTSAQMKEDAARRRALEVLLTELYEASPSLLHRRRYAGRELSDAVWENFEGRCFKCGTKLATQRDMHLDHTRPLALLWPLDETATCLCATHNSGKRDRPPAEYYDDDELRRLSAMTGIPLDQLRDPSPNADAVYLLRDRLDWFFDEFVQREELQMERDGKLPADLLVRAVQKAINRLPDNPLDLEREYRRRHGRHGA
jgi:hypothetical protein